MLKWFLPMKLRKKLTTKQFIISHLVILILGLLFLFGLFYILNIQYRRSSDPFSGGPVTTAPKTLKLDLDSPNDESLVFQSSVLISGKTSPSKDVLIFTETQNLVLSSKKDGSFSTTLSLDAGENNITAVVFDQTGDFRFVERLVYFSKEKL